jgi:hypothetical protein
MSKQNIPKKRSIPKNENNRKSLKVPKITNEWKDSSVIY